MSDLLVYVIIAVVAIAGAAAWLYFPKREPQVRDGQGSRHHRPGSLSPGTKRIRPVHHWPHIERGRRLRCHWTDVRVRSPEDPLTRRQG